MMINQNLPIDLSISKKPTENDQFYFAHGKLLLTGEYAVLDGALAVGLPTKVGQSLSVKYQPSFSPTLKWKSFDVNNQCWFDYQFEFWHFDCINENPSKDALVLQKILQQVRKQNPHFLRDDVDVIVETRLGFPLSWGLGSSSTLINNVAHWAYISPFELLFKTFGGSGYDVACAQSATPITYKKVGQHPQWSPIQFSPKFKNNLYFVYCGNKQNTHEETKRYQKIKSTNPKIIQRISEISEQILKVDNLSDFNLLIDEHEAIISSLVKLETLKEKLFKDFNGSIKSLGAWGGDFFLVSSADDKNKIYDYFKERGFSTILKFDEIINDSHPHPMNDSFYVDANPNIH